MISRLLGLLLALMMAIAPPSGLVVCLDADGCVAVELGQREGSCSPCDEHSVAAAERENAPTTRLLRGSDLPCVDIGLLPFASESTLKLSTWDAQPKLEFVAILVSPPPIHDAQPILAPNASTLPAVPRTEAALRARRSIVLVI